MVQWLCALIFLALPLVQVNGDALLRLDVPGRTLHVFGNNLRVVEFQLLLVAILILVFGFLLMTMILGRVWCGWLCPQTALSDVSEWIAGRVARIEKRGVRVLIREVCHAALAFLLAAIVMWYFIPAGEFLSRLFSATLGPVAAGSLLVLALITYLNLAFMRRLFCREVCPYGRIQFFTTDRHTLTLLFEDQERKSCIGCGACRSVCPVGIDIKEGTQVACINCGRCLDACRLVMAKRGKEGLINYRFGGGGGEGSLWGRRVLLAGVLLLLFAILVTAIATRPEATVKVRRAGAGEAKLLPGAVVNFYSAYLENRGTEEARYTLALAPLSGTRCEMLGPVQDIALPANGNRRVDFAVQLTPPPAHDVELELRLLRSGTEVAKATLPVLSGREARP